jgi:outer membrane protein insertion porin family/translocation and assembly module TamA
MILFWLRAPTLPASDEPIPDRFRVADVRFVGIENVSENELRKILAAQKPSRWKFWVPRPEIGREDLREDTIRIEQFYQRKGYYHAAARYEVEISEGPKKEGSGEEKKVALPGGVVTYSIQEGPPAYIQSVDIQVEKSIDGIRQPDLLEAMTIGTGKVFAVDDYEETKKRLARIYENRGYAFADVSGNVVVDPEKNTAQIMIRVDPGGRYAFGEIRIRDDDGYMREIVIRRALTFKPGDIYSAEKIEESQRNLFNLDAFRVALINPGEAAADSDRLPIEIMTKPKKRQNVRIGIGYGSEDGLRLSGGWTYRNLLGYGGKFSISGKRSDLIENVQADYIQPYFLSDKQTFSSNLGYERERSESFTSNVVFGNAFFERKLGANWTGKIGYNLELSEIEEIKITDTVNIEELLEENDFLISSGQLGFFRNTVDNETDPTRGSFLAVSGQVASGILGSEVDFFRPYVEMKHYRSIYPQWVLAGRIRYETIQDTENTDFIPINKRLFLGGTQTVRGYGYQQLGPLDAAGKPVGGQSALNGNLELRYPVYQKLAGVLFIDMGSVDLEPFALKTEDLRFTGGVGVRYLTPVGPLRLDFGYKLNPPDFGDVSVGPVANPDEETEDRWRIHFSIGQAF